MLLNCMISHFLDAARYSSQKISVTNLDISFYRGGKIKKTLKSNLLKIGHKKSSIRDRDDFFFFKDFSFHSAYFGRNQTSFAILELFL